MKHLLLIFFSVLCLLITSACSNCSTCDCSGDVEEICQSDYDSKAQYDAIIALSESLGCECSN